jgi:hypothetical protein
MRGAWEGRRRVKRSRKSPRVLRLRIPLASLHATRLRLLFAWIGDVPLSLSSPGSSRYRSVFFRGVSLVAGFFWQNDERDDVLFRLELRAIRLRFLE